MPVRFVRIVSSRWERDPERPGQYKPRPFIPLEPRYDPERSPIPPSHAMNIARTVCHPITDDWPLQDHEIPALTHFAICPATPTRTTPAANLGDLTELTDSIRSHGIRQNLLVVPDPDHPGEFRIVIGHRRAAAARLADVDVVPAAVDPSLDDAGQLELMLVENLQRTDLSPVEEADGYQGLLDLGLDVKAIAGHTGSSETTVRSRLRLVTLPEPARDAVHEHRATLEDAAALTEFDDDPTALAALANTIGTHNFDSELASARRKAATRRALAPLLERLNDVQAPQLDANVWAVPDGSTTVFEYNVNWGMDLPSALALLEDATPEWSWRMYYDRLIAYRPMTPEEVEAKEERVNFRPQWQIDDEARAAARAARQERWSEHAAVTNTTRGDFIRSLLARKNHTQAEVRALVTFAGFELLFTAWSEDPKGIWASEDNLFTWLGIDRDAIIAQADADEVDPTDALEVEVLKALAATPPTHRLLTALAAANEPVGWVEWDSPGRVLRAWYLLLEDLGYAVSDEERTALTEPEPEGGEAS